MSMHKVWSRRDLSLTAASLGLLLALTAPAGAEPLVVEGITLADAALWEAAKAEGRMTLYTSQSDAEDMAAEFEKDTGLEAEVVTSTAARIYERVLSEAGAGVLEADVVNITDIVLAKGFVDNGIWVPYEFLGFEKLGDDFKPDDGAPWWIPMQPVNAMAYNTDLVPEADAPRSWKDMLDPKWSDRKLGVSAISGGSNWARWLWLRETYGIEFWQGIADQKPAIGESNGAVMDLLARGEVLVVSNLPGNVAQAIAEGASVKLIVPEDGMVAFSHYVGLGAHAKKPNAGKVFLNWLMSPRGQNVIATKLGTYPVMPGSAAPVVGPLTLPAREDTNIVQPTADGLINRRQEYQQEWLRMMGMAG